MFTVYFYDVNLESDHGFELTVPLYYFNFNFYCIILYIKYFFSYHIGILLYLFIYIILLYCVVGVGCPLDQL